MSDPTRFALNAYVQTRLALLHALRADLHASGLDLTSRSTFQRIAQRLETVATASPEDLDANELEHVLSVLEQWKASDRRTLPHDLLVTAVTDASCSLPD